MKYKHILVLSFLLGILINRLGLLPDFITKPLDVYAYKTAVFVYDLTHYTPTAGFIIPPTDE